MLYRLSYFRKNTFKFFCESLCHVELRKQAFARLAEDFRKILINDIHRSGCGWIRTTEVERQQIYSLPHLATLEHTRRRKRLT